MYIDKGIEEITIPKMGYLTFNSARFRLKRKCEINCRDSLD